MSSMSAHGNEMHAQDDELLSLSLHAISYLGGLLIPLIYHLEAMYGSLLL